MAKSPVLARVGPSDPDLDEEWGHLVIERRLRGGERQAEQVASERPHARRPDGKGLLTDPRQLLRERTRWVDIAVVEADNRSVVPGSWDDLLELPCDRCKGIRSIPIGAIVEAARRSAKTRRRVVFI